MAFLPTNLTKKDILNELEFYARLLKNPGYLILSGIYQEDVTQVTKKAQKLGFSLVRSVSKNYWAATIYHYDPKNA